MLKVIKETENDELTEVLQELIETYSDDIADVAVELCSTLVSHSLFNTCDCCVQHKQIIIKQLLLMHKHVYMYTYITCTYVTRYTKTGLTTQSEIF